MPAFYAHHYFGQQVTNSLDGDLKEIIQKYELDFRIGLQGPDLLLYYQPYHQNRVATYGLHIQEISAYPFFRNAIKLLKKYGRDSHEYAYILGVICHYILDSECHPYIEKKAKEIGVLHQDIEQEFEKTLLRYNGKNPFTFPLSDLIPTDDRTAVSIYPFYKNMNPVIIKQALKDFQMTKRLLTVSGKKRQSIVGAAVNKLKHRDYLKGLMYKLEDNPLCESSNRGLKLRLDTAVAVAAKMIHSFDESLTTSKELDRRFNRTFS